MTAAMSSPRRSWIGALSVLLCFFISIRATGSASADDAATFELFDNGASEGGVQVTLSWGEWETILSDADGDDDEETPIPPGEAFAVAMSSRIKVSKWNAPEPVIATRAFREDGELVVDFEQLLPPEATMTRKVYLVAEDLEFIWPFVEYGYQQIVSTNVVPLLEGEPVVLESLSDRPRVFRVLNLATEEECQALIDTALNATGQNALQRSTVGSGEDADGNELKKEDTGRTSDNAWDHESKEARAMIRRSFQVTNIEEDDGKRDGLQIVRYLPGQGYNTHPDYFQPSDGLDHDFLPFSGGSNRFSTVFIYLNEPEVGGFTVFPRKDSVEKLEIPEEAKSMFKDGTWEKTVNEHCYSKLAVTPKVGSAALFYSILPDGRIDEMSHHAACPLIKGSKWGGNIWIWNKQRFGEIRTGEARTVQMVNHADEPVFLSWEGKDSGSIPPGGATQMNSFEHHRFKASFHSHKDQSFAEFTVKSEPDRQVWDIHRPRRHLPQKQGEGASSDSTGSDSKSVGIKVQITNNSEETVLISWQDKLIGPIEVGGGMVLNTFEGHSFRATPVSDDNVQIFFEVTSSQVQEWNIAFDGDPTHSDEL